MKRIVMVSMVSAVLFLLYGCGGGGGGNPSSSSQPAQPQNDPVPSAPASPTAWLVDGTPTLLQTDGTNIYAAVLKTDGSTALVKYGPDRSKKWEVTMVTSLGYGSICNGFGFTPDKRYVVAICTQRIDDLNMDNKGRVIFVKVDIANDAAVQKLPDVQLMDKGIVGAIAIDNDGMYALYTYIDTEGKSTNWFTRSLDWSSSNWVIIPCNNPFSFDSLTTDATGVYVGGTIAEGGGNNRLWATKYSKDLSMQLWARQYHSFGTNDVDLPGGVAISSMDGSLYFSGFVGDIGSAVLLKIDPATGLLNKEVPLSADVRKIGFSPSGSLYGWGGSNDTLLKLSLDGGIAWTGQQGTNDILPSDTIVYAASSSSIVLYDAATGALR